MFFYNNKMNSSVKYNEKEFNLNITKKKWFFLKFLLPTV